MIEEDYVSFETAKLLKERGLDKDVLITDWWYDAEGQMHKRGNYSYSGAPVYDKETCFNCPTLQMAMKWLRETFGIHCQIDCPIAASNWVYGIRDLNKDEWLTLRDMGDYETYEEACEAAIKYCLKNLIKNEDKEESAIPVPKTVSEAISTLEKILSNEDREYLLKNGAISMHDSLGRWIRNEWGLWTGSELKDELMNMNKGLNHPDDMSNYIIEEFIKYCNEKGKDI